MTRASYYSIVRLNVVESYLKTLGLPIDWNKSYYEQSWAFTEALDWLARLFQIRGDDLGRSRSRILYYRCVKAFNALPF